MKDDERHLLGAAQAAGEFTHLPDIKEDRCNYVMKIWGLNGLLDPDTGSMTAKGMAAKGGVVPSDEVAIEPVETVADVIAPPIVFCDGEVTICPVDLDGEPVDEDGQPMDE